MNTKRAHIVLPEDLIRDIDMLIGPRGRSSFLEEAARNEVRRLKLLQFLESKDAAWKDEDHPELREGSADWVRKTRAESERRPRKSGRKER